ncbi:MAG: GNAT family N-acetyltransferase [Clostridia bacterium]|nr:GNAT family N-acetyltransferase [Clostridia bacterium]
MIRRVFAWSSELSAVCERDVFGTRTLGYWNTYEAKREDVAFYAQYVDGRCVGVLSAAFGHASLSVTADSDLSEWRQFASFLGLCSLLCGRETAKLMQIPTDDSGAVMQYFGTERTCRTRYITPQDDAFSYREVYSLLCECGFTISDYSAWLGDFALRVRKGTANVLCVRDGQTVATASILFDSSRAVYLGAVATHPAYRGRGFGGDLVLSLAQCGKRAQILCKPHRVSFYESLGFRQIGEFVLCPSFK